MNNSTVNRYKRLKVDTEGELQPSTSSSEQNLSEYPGIKKQLNIIECDINQQIINVHCHSATFTTDAAILETVKILFPVPNEVFAGRQIEFDKLSEYFTQNQLAVICGMAGIGKTECSKKFAWNNSSKYGMKLWINADSEENIKKSVHEIARKLSITIDDRDVANIINDIYDYFENRQIYSLFIFDNVNEKRSINHILPLKAYHDETFIHIIITSQNKKWGKLNGKDIPIIELAPLELKYGLKIFRKVIQDDFENYDMILWEKLFKFLNGIPLALQITAAYIKNEIESIDEFGMDDETFSLQGYIEKLENELHLIIDEPFPEDSQNNYSKTVYVAVKTTLEKIKLQSAFDMLYGVSYLSPTHINYDLLVKFINDESIRKSLEILSKYSLVNTNNYKRDRKVGIHRLVQWVLRYHQENVGRQLQVIHYKKIFTTLLNNHPSYYDHYLWVLKHELTFKEIIRDYYVLNCDLSKVHILINYESINSLLLVCESLERNNTKEPTQWIILALQFGTVKSFHTLHEYLDKINKELKCLKTMNDGILLLFVMQLNEDAEESFLETFRQLIELSTDVNVIDNIGFGFTPIMLAAHRGLVKIVHLLLNTRKVDLNRVDKIGWTVFHYVIGSFYLRGNNKLSPLQLGMHLVKQGFDVHVIDQNGRSLLHHACKYISPLYLKYLVEVHKLNVNLKDNFGDVPLFVCFEHQPVQLGSQTFLLKNEDLLIECIDVMAKNGANVNAVNKEGQTILHFAAKYYPLVVEYLLKTHKMDVNAKDKQGVTPSDEIRKRDPCYDDVETSRTVSRIAEYPESQKNYCTLFAMMQRSPLSWTMNIHPSNFKDFSCSYEKITAVPFTPAPSTPFDLLMGF